MTDSDRTVHQIVQFTEEVDCKDSVVCVTWPVERNDFVLLKVTTIFCWADPRIGASWLQHQMSE
jgi:hypothetical protein